MSLGVVHFMDKVKKPYLIWITIIGFFILSRLLFIGRMPVFVDEALDILLGQRVLRGEIFRPLVSGYFPIYFWIESLFFLLPFSPVSTARLTGLFLGLISLIIFIITSKNISNTSGRIWGAILFTLSPMFLFYQRQAVQESGVLLFSILIFYEAIRYVDKPTLKKGITLSVVILLGIFTKTTAIFSLPGAYLLQYFHQKNTFKKICKILFFLCIPLLITPLVLSLPKFLPVVQRNVFISGMSTIPPFIEIPRAIFNARIILSWLISYMTWPIAMTTVIVAARVIWRRDRQGVLLLSWFSIAFISLSVLVAFPYPRYAIGLFIPLYLLLVRYISNASNSEKFLVILLLIPSLVFDKQIIFSSKLVPLPSLDRWQYIDGWPAGFGLIEVRNTILKLTPPGKRAKLYIEDAMHDSVDLIMGADITIDVFSKISDSHAPSIGQLPHDGYILFNYWKPPQSEQIDTVFVYQKSRDNALYVAKLK